MAFCASCGKELPAGVVFCPNCGARVQPGSDAGTSVPGGGVGAPAKDQKAQEHWVRRLIAYLIDLVVIIAAAIVVLIPIRLFGPVGAVNIRTLLAGGHLTLFWGIAFVLYFAIAESAFGASIGKWAVGLKVVSRSGGRPSFADALVRSISKLYWLLLLLDIIVGLAVSKEYHQKYTDKLMGTRVVERRPSLNVTGGP